MSQNPVSRSGRAQPRLAWVACAALIAVTACSPAAPTASPSAPSAVPSSTAPSSGAPSATPTGPASASPATSGTVRLALDWTPNTNHTGFFVAGANGWYADAGVDLQILPYATATPETLIAAGQAECGISFQDAMTFAAATGAPVVSVMAILQYTGQEIAVLASSVIGRPRDLDGRTYAGFGYPNEEPTLRSVITADGGTGEFTSVILDTAAYEALYAKRADFAIIFSAWEGVEAARRGIALRTFAFADYGFPEFYQVVLACDRRWLEREPDLARAFVKATVDGFDLADRDPDAAAALLIEQNPGVFDGDPGLPVASQGYLSERGYLRDDQGRVGHQTLDQWQAYSGFLYEQGLLVDADGKPLSAPPDYAALFTNDFLP